MEDFDRDEHRLRFNSNNVILIFIVTQTTAIVVLCIIRFSF